LFDFLITSKDVVQLFVQDKFAQFISVVPAILVLTVIARSDMGSLYMNKGKLGLSLALGLVVGLASLIPFIAMGGWQAAQVAGPARILSWLPLLAIFSLTNSVMEELWFRAIFLKKLEALLGARASNLLTSIVFAVAHFGAWGLPLVAVTFFLGVACAYIMQKTNSLSGAVLGHAIADILFMLVLVASLTAGA
jgi:membrane protease YdiL (CAAX protease family)